MATRIKVFNEIATFNYDRRKWVSSRPDIDELLNFHLEVKLLETTDYIPDVGAWAALAAIDMFKAVIVELQEVDETEPGTIY